MKLNVIVAAGGSSQRYGATNKLFSRTGASTVVVEAIKPFLSVKDVGRVVVGIETSFADELLAALDRAGLAEDRRIVLSPGGSSRTFTIKGAMSALQQDADFVLIHDGARPYISLELVEKVVEAAKETGVALPLLKLSDSIVRLSGAVEPLDREDFRLVQTPVCVRRDIFETAYKNAKTSFYDDISAIKNAGFDNIAYVDGDPANVKITYPCDLHSPAPLVGCGYDIHRTAKGKEIRLNGVSIPCDLSLVAHSDGDVPVHAIMDAILSALGERDIGHLFPVDDPRFDGADSMQLLSIVVRIAASHGYAVQNVSVAIIAREPLLSPYISDMKTSLSNALNLPKSRVGVSATTNEDVGDLGAGKAIAAYATVSLG